MVGPVRTRTEVVSELTAPGQAFEVVVVQTDRGPQRRFRNAPASLAEVVAEARSEAEYYVYGNERRTFEETYQRSMVLAHALAVEFGVRPGDRVAISMRNRPEWIVGLAAASAAGAVAVALNSMWSTEEFHHGLRDSGAAVLLADGERVAQLAGLGGSVPVVLAVDADDVELRRVPGDVFDLLAILDQAGQGSPEQMLRPPVEAGPEDPATIFYTSGSTGLPKGVLSNHRQVVHALLSWELDTLVAATLAGAVRPADDQGGPSRPRRQTSSLLAVPLFHVTGCHAVALLAFRAQRRIVAMPRWDAAEAARLIESERIDAFVATPAMVADLLAEASTSGRDLSSLRLVGGGGAPRPPEQVRRISSSFDRAAPNNGWGMTETNAIGAGVTGVDYVARPEVSGRPSVVLDLRVVDESGAALEPGEPGELQVRGSSVFTEYWGHPEATAAAFVDGWFRTGDVAVIEADGFVTIVDRIKDLIIRGGENIGCGQVEAALTEHPLVREVAVYGVPDERLGEEVGATVYGPAGLDPEELQDFLVGRVARFAIPRYLTVTMTPLARTATGKIFKRQVRAEALADLRAAGLLGSSNPDA